MGMRPKWEKGRAVLYAGDCVEVMAALDAESVDCVVCDPPYGIGFMGKEWDGKAIEQAANADRENRKDLGPASSSRPGRSQPRSSSAFGSAAHYAGPVRGGMAFQEWSETWVREAYRVLRPGGHLLAFGGTRTYHRLACAVEDAGFEVRDCMSWLYGSGFPKSLDVSKAIDKKRDDYQEVRAVVMFLRDHARAAGLNAQEIGDRLGWGPAVANHFLAPSRTNAACPNWDQWEEMRALLGFGDEMDSEVWRLNGRKGQPGENWHKREVVGEREVPLGHAFAGPTYGGDSTSQTINETAPATDAAREWEGWGTALKPAWEPVVVARKPLIGTVAENVTTHGTGALNIDGCRIGSDETIRPASQPSSRDGVRGDNGNPAPGKRDISGSTSGRWPANVAFDEEAAEMLDAQAGGDTGGPSRFFYVAKASRSERNAGCGELEEKQQDESRKEGNPGGDNPRNRGVHTRKNHHPTVKPVALMRWLVRLVCPPGGTVLDPFAGSGTTGCAAVCEEAPGKVILIEREAEYVDIIKARVTYAVEETEAGRDPFPIEKKPAKRTQSARTKPAARKPAKKKGMTAVELGEQLGLDKAA